MATPIPQGSNGHPMNEERFKVALGCYNGIVGSNHFGSNPTVGTSFVAVQRQGGTHSFPTVAGNFDISSDDTTDTAAGDGARTVLVTGLDANYAEISEVVTMNGQTPVPTVASFLTVNHLTVVTTGDDGFNAGEIYATQDGGSFTNGVPDDLSLVDEQMPAEWSNSESALYTVPAGKSLYIHTVQIFAAAGKVVTIHARTHNPDTVTDYVLFEGVAQDTDFALQRGTMTAIPETYSVWAEAKVDAGSAEVAISIDGWLVDNDRENL